MQITTHPIQNWRGLLIGGVALALTTGFSAPLSASERWETLEAIHRIENPNDSDLPGPCGELGAYQFSERTWHMHTTLPFERATERRVSDAVAVRHYEWLKENLLRAGIKVSPYTIALAWNGGLTSVMRGTMRPATRDYAERVNNIADQLHQSLLLADSR